jgi:REP element-mobilizing transposase RayT
MASNPDSISRAFPSTSRSVAITCCPAALLPRRHRPHRYLHLLGEALLDTTCALHAYVLMDNHVHLLVRPSAAGAISKMMQKLRRG